MKKLTTLFILVTVVAVSAVLADEKTAVWERIYQNSVNDEMRYSVMLNIRELHDRGFGNLLVGALSDLVSRRIELGNNNEIDAKVRLGTALVQELGDLKEIAAADQIFQLYKEVKNFPLLKSEAAMALGKIRALDYVPDLVKSLDSLNMLPDRENSVAQEILAFGLVQALAVMKDARGYEPVFFASIGWYSSQRKVKETARALLKTMVDDPTDSLIKIIHNNVYLPNKRSALEAEDDSNAPATQKSVAALAALEEGVKLVPNNILESTQLSELRKRALQMVIRYADKTPAAADLYRQQYKTAAIAKDTSEILTILQALGVNGTAGSLQFLNEMMAGFNLRAATPGLMTDFDVQQVRTILQAFRTANNPAARPVLLEAQYLYTPALQREIKAVLEGLPK